MKAEVINSVRTLFKPYQIGENVLKSCTKSKYCSQLGDKNRGNVKWRRPRISSAKTYMIIA